MKQRNRQLKLPGSSKWKMDNEALIRRGEITFWVREEVLEKWREKERSGKRGAPTKYPDAIIECRWLVRLFYHLPLRATEGFFGSLMKSWKLDLPVPSYSTLSRRPKGPRLTPSAAAQPIHAVVDSSGLKVYGEGEWKVRMHGVGKRRMWRKLHVGLHGLTGEVLSCEMTDKETVDAQMLPTLLEPIQGELFSVSGDGAFDTEECYQAIEARGALALIPPRAGAVIRRRKRRRVAEHPRDFNLRQIRRWGWDPWRYASGYSRRSRVESHFSRHKRILGPGLRSRSMQNQAAECKLAALLLNKINHNPGFQSA